MVNTSFLDQEKSIITNGACYDVGGNDKFALMEQFAFFWINLAMMQGQGRDIAFKLLKR